MTRLALLLCIFLSGFIFFTSCEKSITTENNVQLEVPVDSTVDSTALLVFKWNYSKDSSTNVGDYYFMDEGRAWSPTPGVYLGKPGDFADFKADGTVDIYANNQMDHSTYSLQPVTN